MRLTARGATGATAAALLLGVFAAPSLGRHAPLPALWIRWFYASACHQRPDRSFLLYGLPLAVCARCTGIYAGAIWGSLLRLRARVALNACAAALALNCIDVVSEMAGLHGNLPWLRLALGMALGAGCGALLASKLQVPPLPLRVAQGPVGMTPKNRALRRNTNTV
jgi:uncharacterized membrane protein